MKSQLFLIVLCATVVLVTGYHRTIGIPTATIIRQHEMRLYGARITEGLLSFKHMHPFFGGILIFLASGSTSVCGSTLISDTKLVTAAHCWDDGDDRALYLVVVLGSVRLFSGGTRIMTEKVEVHHAYNSNTLKNDIALITVSRVAFNDYIKPISLPEGALLYSTFEGVQARVVGYGRTSHLNGIEVSQMLRYAIVTVRREECAIYGQYFGPSNICTNTVVGGPCGGDSGGPLFVYDHSHSKRYLIGVVSYGSPLGCSVRNPTAYTSINAYIDWIKARM